MSSESRIWELRPFALMRGGRELVIGRRAFQPILSSLLYNQKVRSKSFIISMLRVIKCRWGEVRENRAASENRCSDQPRLNLTAVTLTLPGQIDNLTLP
jgi:hypothetical protein